MKESIVKPQISILLTFHAEGTVVYKTLLALKRMTQKLDENNITYEILCHLDNGDDTTREVLENLKNKFNYSLYENCFKEPSQSRNFLSKKAKGKYICHMDGDDLYSENWLINAYNACLKSKKRIIVHPEYNLTFGINETPRLWQMKDSKNLIDDMLILFTRNRWCASAFMEREVALKYPYEIAKNGFGYEDWSFNCKTRYDGIEHRIAKDTTIFYRIKPNGIFKSHSNENVALVYLDAFSLKAMHKLDERKIDFTITKPSDITLFRKIVRFSIHNGGKISRKIPIIKNKVDTLAIHRQQRLARQKIDQFPKELLDEWKSINIIDGELYPDIETVNRVTFYDSDVNYIGLAYYEILSKICKEPDYLILPPKLGIGGTEKYLENHLKGVANAHPDWNILVLDSLPKNHPYEIPKNVELVDYQAICDKYELSSCDRDLLLTRIIIQLKIHKIHILNCSTYIRWILNNYTLLSKNDFSIYLSFFMYEYDDDPNRILSYVDPLLREAEPVIKRIFTDNASIIDKIRQTNYISKDKFSTHYQPVNLEPKQYKQRESHDKYRILWASRIAPQKRPDMINKIAAKLPSNYQIDVYGKIHPSYKNKNPVNETKNVHYKGEFNDISKIDIENYDAYLYTSQVDGIPNILLEISALGLPIIATNEGGVPDFIVDGKSGKLVDLEDVDGYIKAIQSVCEENLGATMVAEAQKTISNQHNWNKFYETIKRDVN